MLRRLIFIYLTLLVPSYILAQSEERCDMGTEAYQAGEKLHFVITYNWFFVWTDVGYVLMDVNDTTLNEKDVLNLKGFGKTFPFYDWFFQVRDIYQSWVDPNTGLPVYYHRDVDEDGYLIDIKYDYHHKDGFAYSWMKKNKKPLVIDTLDITPCTHDVISVIYFARNLDFDKLKIDEKVPISILLDNELTDVYIRYKGKEKKRVKGLGKFKCLKFTGSLIAGSVFKGGEDLELWVTDDENHIPVWVEAPIIIGRIKCRLVGYEGLRHPLKSKYD